MLQVLVLVNFFVGIFNLENYLISSLNDYCKRKKNLEMVSWTLLNSCGLVLDRTKRDLAPLLYTGAEKPLVCQHHRTLLRRSLQQLPPDSSFAELSLSMRE